MDGEIWRIVPGTEDVISASNFGRIRTADRLRPSKRKGQPTQLRRGTIIAPWMSRVGYLQIQVKSGSVRKKYYVHRLVALAFVPGYSDGLSVNHRDGIKTNNRPENLEWVTLAQNSAHQWSSGLINMRGEAQPNHKLSLSEVLLIRDRCAKGHRVAQIASDFGVSTSLIYLIARKERWAHIS